MKDRRRDTRVVEENKVALRPLTAAAAGGSTPVYHALTRDVSVGGLRLMTSAPLEPGERVGLEITLGRSRRRLRAVAEVCWVRDLYAREVLEVGLRFVDLGPESELALMEYVFGGRRGRRG